MSTKASFVDFLLDQLSGLDVRARKMFGEYALYCQEKVVGLICNDQLFIKITDPGKKHAGSRCQDSLPYPGAKPYMAVDGDQLEDRKWLKKLVSLTADALPAPKPKKKKNRCR